MRLTFYLFLISIVVLLFISCGPSQRELAVQQINRAKQSIIEGDTIRSIAQLDSVKILFPKAEVQKVVAKNMAVELVRQLIDQRKNQLSLIDSAIMGLETKFTKEKTEYDQYVQYIPKRQTFDRSWNRSFLLVNLDERGEIYLTSNYMGSEWLYHTSIRVYDEDLQAKSDVVELTNPLNHRSDFLDYKWEKVSYMQGKSDALIQFIAEHSDRSLKCVFLGKQSYYILLEKYDVETVVEALALSKQIKRRKFLGEEIKQFEKQIQLLQ